MPAARQAAQAARASITAAVMSSVPPRSVRPGRRQLAPPPRSRVRRPRARAASTAASTASRPRPGRGRGGASSPRTGTWRAGWRCPGPAMSGPIRGRARTGPGRSAEAAEGSIPSEPVSIADSSGGCRRTCSRSASRRSRAGADELHRRVVDQHVLQLDLRVLAAPRRVTTSRHSREVSSTLALSTEVTVARRGAASRARATRAMRSISATE